MDCTKHPSDPTSCCWQVTNSWYFRQKLGENINSSAWYWNSILTVTGDQCIARSMKFSHLYRSLPCRAIKRHQSSLNWSQLSWVKSGGCWMCSALQEAGPGITHFLKKVESAAEALPWKQHAVKSSGWRCASFWHLSRHCLSFLVALRGYSVKPRKPASAKKCRGPWPFLCFTGASQEFVQGLVSPSCRQHRMGVAC